MRNPFVIGLGLGLVAAVAFASATTGPMLARFALFFLTPLPIALAGLGWGWQTAALAGAVGTLLIALMSGGLVALVFTVSQVVPVVVLTWLALLSRPVAGAEGEPAGVEWYPPGRLVIWAAVMAGMLAGGSLLLIGGDLEALKASLATFVERAVKNGLPQLPAGTTLSDEEIKLIAGVTLGVLPAASAISWMGSLLFNLWLAGRVTLASGQLTRPWPDLAAIEYPSVAALVFAVSLVAATTAAGYGSLVASGVAGAFFLAYVLLGLAIVHYASRGFAWRPFLLWALYAALFIVNIWIGVIVAMIGLSDTFLRYRQRLPAPPPPTS